MLQRPVHTSARFAAIALLACATLAACARAKPVAVASATGEAPWYTRVAPDTITLVRTRCFGRCPAYELVIPRGGAVRVRGDKDVVAGAVAQVPDSVIDALWRRAIVGGFYTLPLRTMGDKELCPVHATDHPSVTLRIVQGRDRTEVDHYTGCYVSADPLRRA